MSGHSKWANIKRRKEAVDGKKAQIYSKLGKEITVAVKQGGPDPASNAKLRDVIAKAKSNNMPNDNINRCIQKASGAADATNYEEISYEGFGPCGVAVIVDAMTDNKNRAAADIRCIFDRSGGSMGQTGSVGYMFTKKSVFVLESAGIDEDTLMLEVLDVGAEDFVSEDGYIEITAAPESYFKISEYLEKNGYTTVESEIKMVPTLKKELSDEEAEKFENFIDKLEANDDVQNVWHNADI
jgi:YebC/PmpR family DNA-binding regulatory protein